MGLRLPSNTRPRSSSPTATEGVEPQVKILSPKRIPLGLSRGMLRTLGPRKPTISPGKRLPSRSTISQASPTEQIGPTDSTTCPTTLLTEPSHRHAGNSCKCWKYPLSKPGVIGAYSAASAEQGQ